MDQIRRQGLLILYKEGKTLDQIGTSIGVSRERVRQLITGPEYFEIRQQRHEDALGRKFKRFNCLQCGSLEISANKTQKFCSSKCMGIYWKNLARKKYAEMIEQECISCKQVKPVKRFYHIGGKSWLRMKYCKQCHYLRCQKWVAAHPEKVKEIQHRAGKKWYDKMMSTPEGRKRIYETSRASYLKVKDDPRYKARMKERVHAYYLAHREQILQNDHVRYAKKKAEKEFLFKEI